MRRWGAAALGRCTLFAALLAGTNVQGLVAQGPSGATVVRMGSTSSDTTPAPQRRSPPALVHYGKWVTLGTSVALGAMAHAKNQDSEAIYATLRRRCFDSPVDCLIGPDGRYVDPGSEALYGRTTELDHQAARLLIGAEVSFAASAVGFVWELMHRRDKTPTIPFEPRVETGPTSTRVSLTFRF